MANHFEFYFWSILQCCASVTPVTSQHPPSFTLSRGFSFIHNIIYLFCFVLEMNIIQMISFIESVSRQSVSSWKWKNAKRKQKKKTKQQKKKKTRRKIENTNRRTIALLTSLTAWREREISVWKWYRVEWKRRWRRPTTRAHSEYIQKISCFS